MQTESHVPWNKDKIIGQKLPLKLEQIWAIRIHLEMLNKVRDLAMFNLAIDSKLRGCDLVSLLVKDVARNGEMLERTQVIQRKTHNPVTFEISKKSREALKNWIAQQKLTALDFLFPSRRSSAGHISTRQYARIVKRWIGYANLDQCSYATHSMRRTKATLIYKQTKNLRAVQILLGHTSMASTVRYLGVEVDDALEISERIEV